MRVRVLNTNFKLVNLKFSEFSFSKINLKRFSTVYDPNSLMYQHKKELDKIQKQNTRMNTPEDIEDIEVSQEMDFEPGIDKLTNFKLNLKACPRKFDYSQSFTVASPEDGFIQLQLPFDTNKDLRDTFRLLHTDKIRNGKLLEILDYMTAFTAYRFNNILPRSKQATIVTASVDSIELFREVDINKRFIINTYPTWTGETSMEVRVDMYNGESSKEQDLLSDEAFLASATFVYVLRDASNYKQKKKVTLLDFDNIEDNQEKLKAKLRQEIGAENKKLRIKKAQLSLFKSPPTQEESAILHEQFVSYKSYKDIIMSQYTKGVDPNVCSIVDRNSAHTKSLKTIIDTRVEKSVLMHSQNINVNGHVFGGYIMREALELAFVCAYMHSNKHSPIVVSIDSVTFHKPVIIGSVAQFIAHVSLVQEELLHVCVEVFNLVDTQECPVLTTTVNITYKTKTKTPRVFPTTYECGVKYLEAKRIIEKLFNIF